MLNHCYIILIFVEHVCQQPPVITNASHDQVDAPTYSILSVATYTCNYGYREVGGSSELQCLEEIWVGDHIMCQGEFEGKGIRYLTVCEGECQEIWMRDFTVCVGEFRKIGILRLHL